VVNPGSVRPPGSRPPPPRISRIPPRPPAPEVRRVPPRSVGRLIRFAPAIAASAAVALVVAARPLGAVPRGIALGCAVAAWAAALLIRQTAIRAHASAVLAIAALTASGQVDGGFPFIVGTAAVLVACLASLRASRLPPLASGRGSLASPRAAIVLFLVGVPITGAFVVGLPWIAVRVERRINALFGVEGDEATAFSSTMVLGATRGMLLSDSIVLRIDGDRPEYLRGAVYDRYDGRFWLMSSAGRTLTSIRADAAAETSTTRITLARGAPEGADMRWFLPPGACDVVTAGPRVDVDAFGVARRAKTGGPGPIAISYRTKGCTVAPAPILAPSASDVELRRELRLELAPIAARWTANAPTDRAKLEAIKQELAHFEYSLSVPRNEGIDPVVDFLNVHRAGHCEMFAAAMVLLARAEGIPARVVGGYRVSEVNPITGRAIVRDRNAHAWVEAFTDGAWHAFDPTPISESFAPQASTFDHLGDLVSSAVDRATTLLARLGTGGLLASLAGFITVLLGWRSLVPRLRQRLRRGRAEGTVAEDRPHPAFARLEGALGAAGHGRAISEPLETFARRLRTLDAPWAREVEAALLGYADLRYGGLGDESAVVADLERSVERLRSEAKS
jgi:hypothetical protein